MGGFEISGFQPFFAHAMREEFGLFDMIGIEKKPSINIRHKKSIKGNQIFESKRKFTKSSQV
jgi:hypothetical protein